MSEQRPILVFNTGLVIKLICVAVALAGAVGLIHTYPTDPGWEDEIWGGLLAVGTLLSFILP